MTPSNPRLSAIRQAYDAGKRHARQEGRAVWTMADYDAALMEYDRLRPYDALRGRN